MHELPMVQKIVDTCIAVAKKNNAATIVEINLELGDFSLVVERLLEHCFEIVSKNTIAENAKLVMTRTPGVLLCDDCQQTSDIWFDAEKNHANMEKVDEYAKTVSAADALAGNPRFGQNLFECKKCHSHNTSLIKGKSILIKNIRI